MPRYKSNTAIETRISTRNYAKEPLQSEEIEKIKSFLEQINNTVGPFETQPSFDLVIETDVQDKQKIGTYGVIRNAPAFVIGVCQNEVLNIFDYAYLMEDLVLYLTEQGFGTCWLGGRFRKQHVTSSITLAENEILPAITPVGYPLSKPHMQERVMRSVLKARQRKSNDEIFFHEDFDQPLGNRTSDFAQALHYVRIAPSAQNKQSWRLIFNQDLTKVHFYIKFALDRHPLYACPPEYLDIGVAYNHFKKGLDEVGIIGHLVEDDPGIQMPKNHVYVTTWIKD